MDDEPSYKSQIRRKDLEEEAEKEEMKIIKEGESCDCDSEDNCVCQKGK